MITLTKTNISCFLHLTKYGYVLLLYVPLTSRATWGHGGDVLKSLMTLAFIGKLWILWLAGIITEAERKEQRAEQVMQISSKHEAVHGSSLLCYLWVLDLSDCSWQGAAAQSWMSWYYFSWSLPLLLTASSLPPKAAQQEKTAVWLPAINFLARWTNFTGTDSLSQDENNIYF